MCLLYIFLKYVCVCVCVSVCVCVCAFFWNEGEEMGLLYIQQYSPGINVQILETDCLNSNSISVTK